MTPQFVRYAEAVEPPEPRFDANLGTVIAKTERYITESANNNGRAVRDAHAKGYGLVRAEVEILGGLAPEYAQGIYATPGTHDAVIRFSNGSPHAGADSRLGSATGLALKLFDVDGPTLLQDEPDTRTFDYTNINGPVFFCNTVEHYLFIQELFLDAPEYFAEGRSGAHRFFREFLTGKGTLAPDAWAWDELLAFLRLAKVEPVNVLLSSYWTMGAVRHGDFIAKVRIAPDPGHAAAVVRRGIDRAAEEAFRPALVAELRDRPYAFDLQVQLCADPARMPVEDVTTEWPERLSPFVTVARVRVPRQDIAGDGNLERMDALSFTPWRVTAEHRPLGSIMRARQEVYRRSSIRRHQLNGQPREEPAGVAELFG